MKSFFVFIFCFCCISTQAREFQFGYFASGFEAYGDYSSEVVDHTNFVNISSPGLNWSLVHTQIAANQNLKVILNVAEIFVDYQLKKVRSDYKTRWADAVTQIEPLKNNILAFYTIDEPDLVANAIGMSQDDMRAIIEMIAKEIKTSFPNIPVAIIYGFGSINGDFVIAKNFDWYGFDCYESFDKCGPSQRSIADVHTLLRQKVVTLNSADSGNRKIMLVPPSSYNSKIHDSEKTVIDILKKYYELAWNDKMVVGMFPFLWQTLNENGNIWTGARELTNLKIYAKKILNSFTLDYRIPSKAPNVKSGSNGADNFFVILTGTNFDLNAVVDVRQNNSERTLLYSENNPARIIKDPATMQLSILLPTSVQDEFKKNGLYFYVVNHDFGTWSDGTLILKTVQILPVITNGGTGCITNQCVWITGNNIATDARLEVRSNDSANKLLLTATKLTRSSTPDGQIGLSFEISDQTVLNTFKSPGLRITIVNTSAGTSSLPYVVTTPSTATLTPVKKTITVPSAPIIGKATIRNTQATVSFTAPTSNGGAAIKAYTVTLFPGKRTVSSTASPITIRGLRKGIFYKFSVTATNTAGTSAASSLTNAVKP